MAECYYQKYSDNQQCQNPAVYKSKGAGNMTDDWTWCAKHAPPERGREPLKADERGEE